MKTVLIIEDDQRIALALEIRMKAKGYATIVTHDAIVGTSQAVRHKPDLILLDISMPGGNGLALAAKFHKLPETKDVPIIFATASKDPQLLSRVVDLEAVALFEKPFDTDELVNCVERILNGKEKLASLAATRS
jgi:two-component system sensor histidine kinase/response regulator